MLKMLVAATLISAVALGWYGVVRLTRSVRRTSLTVAAVWATWFQMTLTVTVIATVAQSRLSSGILDQLWYLTAVSALCPLVAVLGARRGRVVEWSLFILLPLIVVLEWPALAQVTRCWNGQRLELETPALVGFTIVLLMGAGNFVGTRFTWPAFFFVGCWGPVAWFNNGSHDPKWILRDPAVIVGATQLWFWFWSFAFAHQQSTINCGWDRILIDFRDRFGLVWGTRLMARVNEVAQRDNWPWRVTADGLEFVSNESQPASDPNTDPRVDQTFRWLLKPFVDPEWIDERLAAATDRTAKISNGDGCDFSKPSD